MLVVLEPSDCDNLLARDFAHIPVSGLGLHAKWCPEVVEQISGINREHGGVKSQGFWSTTYGYTGSGKDRVPTPALAAVLAGINTKRLMETQSGMAAAAFVAPGSDCLHDFFCFEKEWAPGFSASVAEQGFHRDGCN